MSSNKVVYATCFNLDSLNHGIYKCYWNDELQRWSDNTGDFDVEILGWQKSNSRSRITYASPNHTDVERVVEGAQAVLAMLYKLSIR